MADRYRYDRDRDRGGFYGGRDPRLYDDVAGFRGSGFLGGVADEVLRQLAARPGARGESERGVPRRDGFLLALRFRLPHVAGGEQKANDETAAHADL